jgi:hypothetical protein
MNEFTIEELEEIQEIARHCHKQGVETKHNLTYAVKVKAESMIDNYKESTQCRHKNIVTGAYPRAKPPKACPKCGVLYYV